MQKRMREVQKVRKGLGKSILAYLIILGMFFSIMTIVDFMKPLKAEAACSAGIKNNGLGGISININAAPYTEKNYNNIAYGNVGCTWFAACRAQEVTGVSTTIWSGNALWNNGNGRYGWSTGKDLKEKAFVCYSGHVAIIEKIEGDTVYISEGGSGYSDYAHGYCVIRTATKAQVMAGDSYTGTYLGCVYFPGATSGTSNGTVTGVYTDDVSNITKNNARINGRVTTNGKIDAGQMTVSFGINEYQDNNARYGHDIRLYGNGTINLYWDLDSIGITLKEGTRYWYKVYASQNGKEFGGEWKSFVTAIDFTPQNLGNSFYAYIKSKDSNMYVSNPSVSSNSKTAAQLKQKASGGTNNELWCFTRQSNGAYKIQSVFDSRFMCPWNGSVYAGYADTTYWYIQKDMGGYRLRQFEYAASGLGVSSKTEGSAISFCDVKPSVASQIFDIQIVAPENVNFRPAAVTYTGNHVYEMYDSCVNWAQANAIAKKKGGHLVTITSSDEMNFLKNFMNNSQYKDNIYAGWWMGYTDVEKEGTWKWTTGETSSYTNWRSDQPDNAGGNEDYAMLWGGNKFAWNDATGKECYGFIVEYDNLQKIVPVQTMTYNGHRYELYDIPVNKVTAAGWANQKGGYLVTITSSQEMEQITAMARKSTLYKNNLYGWYIGLGRDGATNTFKWGKTGEDFSYKNWSPGEPNFANKNEYSVVVCGENASTWNDVPGESYFGFVVEYDEDWNPELKISAPEEVLPGETFDVSISVSANPAVASVFIDLLYDNSLLEIVPADFDRDEDLMQYNAVRNLDYKEKAIRFAAADIHGIDWSNKVFTVTFRVKENVKRGTLLSFEIENAAQDMLAVNGYSRPAGAVSAGATVLVGSKYCLGDVNEDGKVAVADALAILMHLADKEVANFDEDLADVDKDGKVAVADALAILMHLVGKQQITE